MQAEPYRRLINEALGLLKQHQPDLAIDAFRRAMDILPDHMPFDQHYYLGVAFQQMGQLKKAVSCFLKALDIDPESDDTFLALAGCLQAQSDYQGAQRCYRQLLQKDPSHPKAAFGLGTLYLHRNDIDEALKWLLKAQDVKPEWLLQNNLGKAFLLKNDLKRALECFQKALQETPEQAEIWFNLAELYTKTDQCELAISHYRKAIQRDPAMIAAYNNMGNVLRESQRYDEAIAAFQNVLALAPELAQGHYNLGGVYRLVEDYERAVEHLSKAIQLKPDYADAWNNLALTCKNMGDLDRAMTYFNRALQIDPELAVARWNRSFVNFLTGNWLEGWHDFEARFDVPHWRTIYPHRIDGALWDGGPIPGKTLFVHDEQGLGDTIQFARLLPWARQRCEQLILETREELIPLLEDNPAIDRIIIRSKTHPPTTHFDCYIPLMSIARLACMTPQKTAGSLPYITAEKAKSDCWQRRLETPNPRVGLVWAGRPQHGNDTNRSCNLAQFAPLFRHADIHFVGLQKGLAAAQVVSGQWSNFDNIGPHLDNFGDTAAVLSQLDLLISVDTAVAHLAGAMGRPVWVLLPFIPDWRWGMRGQTTSWYPTMQLFRQHRPKDWASVIERINLQLQKMLADRKSGNR